MPIEFIFFASLSYIFWGVAVAFNAANDILTFKYEQSIFSTFKKGSWADWYFRPPDETDERKYTDLSYSERRKIWIFTVPVAFYDGWHGMKLARQLFTFASMIMCAISGTTWVHYKVYSHQSDIIWSWHVILGSLIGFMFIAYAVHTLFFKRILIK